MTLRLDIQNQYAIIDNYIAESLTKLRLDIQNQYAIMTQEVYMTP